jgi:hypothetical protein
VFLRIKNLLTQPEVARLEALAGELQFLDGPRGWEIALVYSHEPQYLARVAQKAEVIFLQGPGEGQQLR